MKGEIMERPDVWELIRITNDGANIDKILSGWYGGYANGDSWRFSSRISKMEERPGYFYVVTESGTEYELNKSVRRFSGMTAGIYEHFAKKIEEQNKLDTSKVITIEILK